MKKGWQFRSPYILQNLIWIPTRLLFKFFLRMKIRGGNILRALPQGVVFALNHTSELDAVILPASFHFFSKHSPMFYVSREQSFYKKSGWRQTFYGGGLFRAWGAYAAKVGLRDYKASLAEHINILEKGGSICIFPEGKRNLDDIPQKAKGGAAYLSWITKKPIVPVLVLDLKKIGLADFLSRKHHTEIIFGKPVFPEELFKFCGGEPKVQDNCDNFREAAQSIMDKVQNLRHLDKRQNEAILIDREEIHNAQDKTIVS